MLHVVHCDALNQDWLGRSPAAHRLRFQRSLMATAKQHAVWARARCRMGNVAVFLLLALLLPQPATANDIKKKSIAQETACAGALNTLTVTLQVPLPPSCMCVSCADGASC